METKTREILKLHGLRLTDCRKQVMGVFLRQEHAIGQPELERQLADFDRVTIYRTLHTFMDKGIIHQVLDNVGGAKYALCSAECNEHNHEDEHVHFKCVVCNVLKCIAVEIPNVALPVGHTFQKADLLISGICDGCQ